MDYLLFFKNKFFYILNITSNFNTIKNQKKLKPFELQ